MLFDLFFCEKVYHVLTHLFCYAYTNIINIETSFKFLFTEPNKLLMGTEEGLYVALLNKDGKINVTTAKKKEQRFTIFYIRYIGLHCSFRT